MEKDKSTLDDYALIRAGTNDINFETGEQVLITYSPLVNFHLTGEILHKWVKSYLKANEPKKQKGGD